MALAALVLVCTLFGTWAGGFFGIQTENYKVRQFHAELDEGQHLLMVDVDRKHEHAIRRLMAHHREAVPMGVMVADSITAIPGLVRAIEAAA